MSNEPHLKSWKSVSLNSELTIPDLMRFRKDSIACILNNAVDVINWKDFDYKPDVKFSISYTRHEILLKYYVTEQWFKAEKTETNQEVYEDSCVEFFVAPSDDGIYYNFELNAIGTCLMASGTGRGNRNRTRPRDHFRNPPKGIFRCEKY